MVVLDLGFVAVLAVVAAGLGSWVLGWLREQPDHPVDAWGLAVTLGLGMLALGTLGLASVGGLTGSVIAIFGLVALGSDLWPGVRSSVVAIRALSSKADDDAGWIRLPVNLAWLAGLGGTLITALLPVTDGDALCYHLQVPKVFLLAHGTTFEPDLHETVYPLANEMLYALTLATRGPVACRLVEWLLGLVFALIVNAMARPSLGEARARWAGVIALLCPAVSTGMGAPLNDVALAAFGNAAILGWTRWRDRPSIGAASLAGVLLGLAIGVKYPALVLGGILGLGFVLSGPPQVTIRRRIGHALLFGVVALLVGGSWYYRAYAATGNPVFPFYRHVFGGSGIDEVLDPIKRPMTVNAWNVLTALIPMTLNPARFDSFAHQFGPVFLLFLPPLLWMRPPRSVWQVVAVGYLFLTLCVTQRQSMRFVLIAVGPMSVGVVWLASRWVDQRRDSWASRGLILLLASCLVFESGLALVRGRSGWRVVAGLESSETFLARREPTFVVGRWIDANLPIDARLIGQDHRGFYLPRPYAMELAHRRRTGLGSRGESAEAIVQELRDDGFTHLMLCPPEPEDAVEFDPTLGHLLTDWLRDRVPIYDQRLGDGDGVVRRYQIYELNAGDQG